MNPPDWTTLRIFLAALELGSVTKAANHHGIAVSAAAKRIQELEAEHGLTLLERTARGVRPTMAGELLGKHARNLLILGNRLNEELAALQQGGAGSVQLCASPSAIAGHDLPELLATFRTQHPGVTIDLVEEISLVVIMSVTEGRADIGLITTPGPVPAELTALDWRHDHLLAVMSHRHHLATRASIRFSELLDCSLIGVLQYGALSLQLEEAAQRVGRQLKFGFRVASTDTAIQLVRAGHGITIMPNRVLRAFVSHDLIGVPLEEPWSRRQLRLVTRGRADLSAAARRLLDHLSVR